MADVQADAAGAEGAGMPALPRARVLSYVAPVDSPTRVRKVASRVIWVLGWLCVLAGVGVIVVACFVYVPMARDWYMYRGARSWGDFVGPLLVEEGGILWLLFAGYLFGGGLSHLLFARPVSRGSKAGCRMTCVVLIPALLGWLLIGAVCGTVGLMMGVGVGENHWAPLGLLWFVPMAIAVLIFMLLTDLMGYLEWIARNPITEKPAVAFLPRSR